MSRTTWMIVIVLAATAVGGCLSLGWFAAGTPVEAALVKREAIEEFIDEQAVTRLPQTYLISMPFSGRIQAIDLTEGTPVKQGQVVAQVVPQDLDLAKRESEAMIERLAAAVKHEADTSVERTAAQQADEYVRSMASVVGASASQVESGRAKYDYAERFFNRAVRLFQGKAISDDQYDQAELQKIRDKADFTQYQLTHAAMQAMQAATNLMPKMIQEYIARKTLNLTVAEKQKAEAQVQQEKIALERQRGAMTSPVDGLVLKRFVSNEGFLPAGTALLEIGRPEEMEVEVDVLTLDVPAAHEGSLVQIYGPAVGEPRARGQVRKIYPAGFTKVSSLGVEQQRVKVIVAIAPDDLARLRTERNLKIGYRVRARIQLRHKAEALVLPRSALFRGADGAWQVYAVRNGTARLQTVKLGLLNDETAEVLEGLAAGETVIVAPERNLAEGDRVRPIFHGVRP